MKKLLAAGQERIFQITRSFRSGERGDLHSPEFTMLEWYVAGQDYGECMELTEELVREGAEAVRERGLPTPCDRWPRPFPRVAVDDIFHRTAGWRPSRSFEADAFFLDLIEKVEPELARKGAVFLFDFPERLGALARPKAGDPLLCERFELYLDGLETCNGFSELTDPVEQRRRFERDNAERRRRGREPYPVDEGFLAALERGMPPSAGNALGVDRLLLALTGERRLADVTLLADGPAGS
jgi:lysyl-tRNA synthetase class 2